MFLLVSGLATFCIYEGFSFNISPGKLIDDFWDNLHNMNARAAYEDDEKVVPDSRYKIEAVIIKNGEQVEMKINPTLGLGFTSQIDADTEQNSTLVQTVLMKISGTARLIRKPARRVRAPD